jgi:hypothetical protein
MGRIFLNVPIRVSGVPAGEEIRADALAVAFVDASGKTWRPALGVSDRYFASAGVTDTTSFHWSAPINQQAFDRWKDRQLTLHASIYLTLFGNQRQKTIPLQIRPVNVVDGLQCSSGLSNDIFCRSAFRWPARIVDAKGTEADTRAFTQFISYSPFPAGMSINPIETRWAAAPVLGVRPSEVTIVVAEPLAHLHRDIEVSGIRLGSDESRGTARK